MTPKVSQTSWLLTLFGRKVYLQQSADLKIFQERTPELHFKKYPFRSVEGKKEEEGNRKGTEKNEGKLVKRNEPWVQLFKM